MLIIPIALPIFVGIVFMFMQKHNKTQKLRLSFVLTNIVTAIFTVINVFYAEGNFVLWNMTKDIPIEFYLDNVGIYFSLLTSLIWVLSSIYSIKYFNHEEKENQFFGFFTITYGVLLAIDYSANLMTAYLFFEILTFVTIGLVVHSRSKESITAGLKYLVYSLFGAFMGLICIFFIQTYADSTQFMYGGYFNTITENKDMLLYFAFFGIVGFCTKAGMFPLHGWLPQAHPVAPAPASAVLSGIITKAGVLMVIRLVYFVLGADFIKGTWVQYTWIALTLVTVVLGSVMAYKEKGLKKRLAYSTVSQVSYVLFGLSMLNEIAFTGALLHISFHSIIKVALFLSAGAIIFKTGITQTENLTAISKKLPKTMLAFTVASLALVGIPPLNGFFSKWNLALGAFSADISPFSWLGPALLLLSAVLTAGYLLSISYNAYSKSDKMSENKKIKEDSTMNIVLIILAALTLLTGLLSNYLANFITNIAQMVI